jgi:ceramide glucosyltransferase
MTIVLYILSGLALVQGLASLRDGRRNLNYARTYKRSSSQMAGTVVVFCPVRGTGPDLEDNVGSLLEQSHPDYRVVYIVDSELDPAFPILDKLSQGGKSEVFVAGEAVRRGQKVHNLATAVTKMGREAAVFVFCDADARFRVDWLQELVAPLADPKVGATTGYRWYLPPEGGGQRLLRSASLVRTATRFRSAWNASVAGYFGPHSRNFVWGGSTGIRRETFESAKVLEFWVGALSDDYALTRAVRGIDLDIVYVPLCLVPSYDTCGPRQLLEFTTRQIKITRVYSPAVWRTGIASYTLFNVTFLWLTSRLGSGPVPVLLWISLYFLAALRADARVQAAGLSISDRSLKAWRWFYALAPPFVALLYQWNLIVSIFSRSIDWKGIRYTMIGPNQTIIRRPSGDE